MEQENKKENLEDTIMSLPSDVPSVQEAQFQLTGDQHVFIDVDNVHSVMLLNEATEQGEEIIDERLDVEGACSVIIKKELIVLKWGGPVKPFKYTYFTDKQLLTKTALSTLPLNNYL